MARNASGVSSWLLVHNLGRLICSLHHWLEKISKAHLGLPGHVGLDQAQDRRITSRRKTDFLIFFPRNFRFLKSLARSLRRELKCLHRHAPWPSCHMILIRPPRHLDQATAAAPKNVEITSVRIPLQALLSQTRKTREHMTTEHTVVRSGKLKRKLFNSNVAGNLLTIATFGFSHPRVCCQM
jgi:hypothetical protein